jgi:hypothetical protein
MLARAYLLAPFLLSLSIAAPAAAAPEMFEASFIFHAWGNDVSSGTPSPYATNDWTALPLGYDCMHVEPYTTNGAPASSWCSPAKMQGGHPAAGAWSADLGTGMPPRITLQQSDFGIHLGYWWTTYPWGQGDCCRGIFPKPCWSSYLQTATYATFVNAAGSFFAGGGAAAGAGYVNRTPMAKMSPGTWRIRAGKNAFGGAMGLLGKYGATRRWTIWGKTGTYRGVSSWAMVPDVGRPLFNTIVGYGAMGTPLYQNPFSKTDMWYKTTPKGQVKASTILAIGSGTLWTTGQVGAFAKTGAYYTSFYRTGYDNRTPAGLGNIQLVTPTLTHWLSPAILDHTAHIALLTIRVPEPSAVLLLAAGAGALAYLRRASRNL